MEVAPEEPPPIQPEAQKPVNPYQEVLETITRGNLVEATIPPEYNKELEGEIAEPVLYGVDERGHLYIVTADGNYTTVMEIQLQQIQRRYDEARAAWVKSLPVGYFEEKTPAQLAKEAEALRQAMIGFGATLADRPATDLKLLELERTNFLRKSLTDENGQTPYRDGREQGATTIFFTHEGEGQQSVRSGDTKIYMPVSRLTSYLEARVPITTPPTQE